jgi:hypothetical protein
MKTLANALHRAEIEGRIQSLRPESERQWGSMAVGGMLCHLTDSYEFPMGERPVAPMPIPMPRLIKCMALRSPLPWARNLRTLPEVKQGDGGSAPAGFAAEQQRLLATFARFCASPKLARSPHPMFGAMSADDWMRWGYRHADHHLRQFGA